MLTEHDGYCEMEGHPDRQCRGCRSEELLAGLVRAVGAIADDASLAQATRGAGSEIAAAIREAGTEIANAITDREDSP